MTTTNPRIEIAKLEDRTAALEGRASATEDMFRLLVDSVRDYAIYMLDRDGNVATWNEGAERITGFRAYEVIGRPFATFYPPEAVKSGRGEQALAVAEREGRSEEEGWRVRKDGSWFWANVAISAVRNHSDALIGFANVTRDLTERKRAEDARLGAEERFRLLVDSVRDYAIFMLDQGHVVTWNAGASGSRVIAPKRSSAGTSRRSTPRSMPTAEVRDGARGRRRGGPLRG